VTTLRVIVDDIVSPRRGVEAGHALALTRALIASAPRGSFVEGIVSASPEDDYALLARELPGLGRLAKSVLARRELRAAWRGGVVGPGLGGMIHSPGLLAPLLRHDRLQKPGEQVVVTIADTLAWTAPDRLPGGEASWSRAMAKRAERHADAVVVPSHAVAEGLSELLSLGERVRVIPPAPLLWPTRDDPAELDAASPYLVTVLRRGSGSSLALLLSALLVPELDGLELHVIATPDGPDPADLDELPRVRVWRNARPAEQRALLARASAYIDPAPVDGGSPWLLEALASGAPAIHLDVAPLVELAAGATVTVAADDDGTRLGEAVATVLADAVLTERMRVAGMDRARAFTWRDTAERVWQLHADL
jgi:glycosyltransferase involved in cell wall biosynthesis